eukprot:COSAG06_NODE_10511_length_1668_cov_47.840973_2_plen_108_part_00
MLMERAHLILRLESLVRHTLYAFSVANICQDRLGTNFKKIKRKEGGRRFSHQVMIESSPKPVDKSFIGTFFRMLQVRPTKKPPGLFRFPVSSRACLGKFKLFSTGDI